MTIIRRIAGRTAADVTTDVLVDTSGRMKQSHAQPSIVTGTLSAVAQTTELDMDGFSSFTVVLGVGSTFAGATIVMEQTLDGTNWQSLLAVRGDAAAAPTATLLSAAASQVVVFGGFAPGAIKVRVRCSALTSGSVSTRMAASTAAVTPVTQTHAITGTATVTPATPTAYALEGAASTNATLVVGSATSLMELTVFNPTGSTVYLKLFNKATAPVPGTDTPIVTIPVLADQNVALVFGHGKRFATGLGFAITAAAAKADTTAVGAGVQLSLTRL